MSKILQTPSSRKNEFIVPMSNLITRVLGQNKIYLNKSTHSNNKLFFSWELCPFKLAICQKKYTAESVCQRNSSETAQQNLVKLYAYYRKLLFFFSEKKKQNFSKNIQFCANYVKPAQHELQRSISIRIFFDCECPNITQM